MTHHPIKVLEDGTRVYSNYARYKPKEDRKYAIRKPDDPRAVRWLGEWLLPLPLLPMHERVMPLTRPDTDAYDHMSKPRPCKCQVCKRPESERWKKKWLRDQTREGGS